ncbi:MAG: hypothetical protein U1A27_00025 [Phycisphaerae bacterium]
MSFDARSLVLPATNPARLIRSAGGELVVAFKAAAGADLAVYAYCGPIRQFSAAALTKARIGVFTTATSGNHHFRLNFAAVKAGESLASGPAFSATNVDFAVTAVPNSASVMQVIEVTVPVAALDGLVEGDELVARLSLIDSDSTVAADMLLRWLELRQEL